MGMVFRLRKATRAWFTYISRKNQFDRDFDMYYLCLMAGLAKKRQKELENEAEETTELITHFPDKYKEKGRLIISLFISRELENLGIALTDKNALEKALEKIIDPEVSGLSDFGMSEMNKYSYGGHEVLTEWFDEKPRTLETFLPRFHEKLKEGLRVT